MSPLSEDLESLIPLAKRLAGRRRYEEAAELLSVALRLEPDNRGAQLALAEVRKRQGQATGVPAKSLKETLLEQTRRDAIDAAHFIGLAHLYAEKGENARAQECLQVAEARRRTDPSHFKLRGRIAFRRKEFEVASEALSQALRLNPFDRETAETLGRAEYECGRFEAAVRITAHAFLLLHEGDEDGAERLRRRIRTLKQILGWGNRELTQVFHDRQQELHIAFDRLEWHKERFFETAGVATEGVWRVKSRRPGRVGQIDQAARLRRQPLWSHLSDTQVFRLTEVAEEQSQDAGSELFIHGSPSRDVYLIESGEVKIQRPTPYGTFTLAHLGPGSLIGEVGFLEGSERSGDAVVTRPSQLIRFDSERLDRAMEDDTDLAAQVLWTFWHSLAGKLRSTNEQLRSFFSQDARSENFLRLRRPEMAGGAEIQQVKVDSSDKIRLFREKGLSGRELTTLATFSREQRFPAHAYVFQEGDEGNEMYIILEGRARISKFIPGGGEEALAILERGDFFGEMSLFDGAPRSADARSHGGPLTVLAVDEATIKEVLTMDAAASSEFLRLLCRLITQRLREIDEKVIGWRILAGDREEDASA